MTPQFYFLKLLPHQQPEAALSINPPHLRQKYVLCNVTLNVKCETNDGHRGMGEWGCALINQYR